MSKPTSKIEQMTKEQLIDLCKRQKETLSTLNMELERKSKENNLLHIVLNTDKSINIKMQICIMESLSLMEDIERLKQKIKKLEKSNGTKQ